MTLMTFPLEDYERKANDERSADIYESEMLRSVLEREKKSIEDKVAKGKADREELKKKAEKAISKGGSFQEMANSVPVTFAIR